MSTLEMQKDVENLTLSFVAEYEASPDRVWQLWEDPRQLERWWGPPTWPATFPTHDLTPGATSAYYMTGPEGERSHGWWRILTVDKPNGFTYDDGFADDDGNHLPEMGTIHATVVIESLGDRTRMTVASRFDSREDLDKLMAMGMEEGMRDAMSQIDAILAE